MAVILTFGTNTAPGNHALECGQAALEQLQEELSEKAESEKTAPQKAPKDRGRKGNTERLYPSLSDIEDSDGESTDSTISEMDSLIQGMHRAQHPVGPFGSPQRLYEIKLPVRSVILSLKLISSAVGTDFVVTLPSFGDFCKSIDAVGRGDGDRGNEQGFEESVM
ncbi:hypothetical protein STEG23_010238, partial [Scotinomys teguina]